jgi:hypothetical protein
MVNCVHFFSPKPKKTSLEDRMHAQVGVQKKVANLNVDEKLKKTNQIAVKYLHEGPLSAIS